MKIYGVVGWKNAGKTGLMERLVAEVTARGFAVSTIKHAHHAFDLDQPGKDSHRHRAAGAREVLLASYKRWALLHEIGDGTEPPMEAMLAKLAPCDLVLVEGYKRDNHPKVEVFRDEAGHALIQPGDPTVRAVASDIAFPDLPVPRFDLDDTGAIADFILAETGLAGEAAKPALADACFVQPEGAAMASVAEAGAMLRAALAPVTAVESLPVAEATGRFLARDALALRANPPASNSAMDGYGFAAASQPASDPVTLTLLEGRAAAGAPFAGTVQAGAAIRILTGALLPDGVDTVVMQEHVTVDGGTLRFDTPLPKGTNTRLVGEDMRAGALALASGTRLGPAEVGMLTALGVAEVALRAPLRVGVLSTGDELAAPGETLDPARTYDANRPMLLAMARAWGFEAVDLGRIADDRDTLRAALDDAAARVDVILTSGGASGGDEDHVSALIASEGHLSQWRVALKPGKPLVLGQWQRVPIFGLPGNPVSAFTTACLFAAPSMAVLAGGDWPTPQGYEVTAGFSWSKPPGRRNFLRARIAPDGRAEVFRSDSSGMISSLGWGTGFVELGEEGIEITPGDRVRFVPFSSFGL